MRGFILSGCLIIILTYCQSPPSEQAVSITDELMDRQSLPEDTFKIDTTLSIITWIGSKPSVQHNGIIRLDSGSIGIKKGQIVTGVCYINIPSLVIMGMDPAKEDYPKLYRHLMSDDFFDAGSFPTATVTFLKATPFDSTYFNSHSSEFIVDTPTHVLECALKIRGTELAVVFPAQLEITDSRIRCEGKFSIDRTQWGISYDDEATVVDKIKDKFIHNTVFVGFSVVAVNE